MSLRADCSKRSLVLMDIQTIPGALLLLRFALQMAFSIGIVAKPRPEVLELAAELRRWLRARKAEVLFDESTASHLARTRPATLKSLRNSDLLVTLGGDGTLLQGAGLLGGAKVPLFGVNMGYLGFLTEISRARLFPVLEDVLDGRVEIEDRMLLRVELFREDKKRLSGLVLNDAVVTKGALARMMVLDCFIDQRDVARYRADGLIVATPTGSTAYTLSAGGPIVYPTMRGMIIAPICPHTLTQRPLVVSHSSVIRLVVSPGGDNLYLTLDGQRGRPLKPNDEIVVREARRKVYLVRDPTVHFFQVLRDKLGWGG